MYLNKEKDNPYLIKRNLDQIIVYNFNQKYYTKRKFI